MDTYALYHRSVEAWASAVNSVRPDQWDAPTPCREWTVRDLVNHVAGEDRWTVPLTDGATVAEVGDRLAGDLLGDDPIGAALAAAWQACEAVARRLPTGGTVSLSYGAEEVEEYVRQLTADHLVHAWDLAAATGGDTRMDAHLVLETGSWFAEREARYRAAGLVGPRRSAADHPQAALLAGFGRAPDWRPETHGAAAAFSAAFGAGDVEAIMALMTHDCVFEATTPPDGQRHEGAAAVRRVWKDLFTLTDAHFAEEELDVRDDRAVLRWRFSWSNADGTPGHVRGVDLLRLRDGLVAEELSYVKG